MRRRRQLMLRIGLLGGLIIAVSPADAAPSPPPLVPEGETFEDPEALIGAISRASPVNSAAISPDGRLVASASEDGSVRLWDRATGREVRRFDGHGGPVLSVAFGPGGEKLVSASEDGSLRLWEINAGETWRVEDPTWRVLSATFSPDGKIVASASEDGKIGLWDGADGHEIQRLDCDGKIVFAVAFSADGETLASASEDGVRLWELDSGSELLHLEDHGRSVRSVAFAPDGLSLASASDDGTVRLWDVLGVELQRLEGHQAGVHSVAFSPDGLLASASGDATVRLWDPVFGDEIRRFEGHGSDVLSVSFSRDGKLLLSASSDTTVRLWNVATRRELQRFEGHASAVRSLSFAADGRRLAAASDDGMVRFWDVTGRVQQRLQSYQAGAFSAIFSPNGQRLAAIGDELEVLVLDLVSGETQTLSGHESWVLSLAFSPDGRTLASSSEDGRVHLWNLATGRVRHRHEGPGQGSLAMAFSRDGKLLASGSGYAVRVWEVGTERFQTLLGHESWIFSLAFHPDGQLLASGSGDGSVRLWSLDSGDVIRRLANGRAKVFSVAFSPDGQILAAGSEDGRVSLWEVESGRLLRRFKGHSSKVFSLAFSPDGQTLASSSGDGTVRIWDPSSGRKSGIFLGGQRGNWIGCNGDTCLRHDDGTLLAARDDQTLEPVPPPSKIATLELVAAQTEIRTLDGRASPLILKVRNRGSEAVYWLRVRRVASAVSDRFNLRLPPPLAILGAGEVAELELGVSFHARYENPQETKGVVALEISGVNSEPLRVPEITVFGEVPSFEWGRAAWTGSGDDLALAVELTNRGGQELLAPYFTAETPEGRDTFPGVSYPDAINPGQTRRATLTAPKGTRPVDRISLIVRTREHPTHTWRAPEWPVSRGWPLFQVSAILLLFGVLVAGHLFHPLVRRLSQHPEAIRALRTSELRRSRYLLWSTGRLARVLDAAGVEQAWLDGAVTFWSRPSLEARSSWLGDRLGTRPRPHADAEDLYILPLGADFPLNLEDCLIHQPRAGRPAADVLTYLRARPGTRNQVTLVVGSSRTQQEELHRHMAMDRGSFCVAPSGPQLTELLLAADPVSVLARLIASQVKLTRISPYQIGRGVDKESSFFGRSELLDHIRYSEPSNYLFVGARQIGKSSLLKAIERRYRDQPEVECHYLVLFDGDLVGLMARAVDLPRGTSADDLFAHLLIGRRRVFLIDEADALIRAEHASGHGLLARLRSLSEQGRCHFILAGFWDLYSSAVHDYQSPLKNFGEIKVIDALESDACRELATVPMSMMGLRYASDEVVDHLVDETGRRANLISIACDELLRRHASGERILGQDAIEAALSSRRLERAMGGWSRLCADEVSNRLDHVMVWATISRSTFTQPEAVRLLEEMGVEISPESVSRSLERLELAFVLSRDETRTETRYTYRVPLFRQMLLKHRPEFQLERELEFFRARQRRSPKLEVRA